MGDEVVASGVRLVDLDAEQCVEVGTTSRGTRIEVFKPYLDADLRICTGNIEYHYFAGFSGGAKAVVPGMCSYAAIRDNHSMMLAPTARAGVLEGNPVRDDIDEAGGMVGIDYLFNVVLDEEKRVLHAVAGHYLEAHRAGVALYDARCDLRVAEAADVVIASPGGRPKDINLYQAQKTLDNVAGAVREGGVVVLVARCPEGFGQKTFESWMRDMGSPDVLVERIQQEFVLGGHKAAAIAGMLRSVDVFLVSEFPDDVVRGMCMRPFATVDEAVRTRARALRRRLPCTRGAARQPRDGGGETRGGERRLRRRTRARRRHGRRRRRRREGGRGDRMVAPPAFSFRPRPARGRRGSPARRRRVRAYLTAAFSFLAAGLFSLTGSLPGRTAMLR